MVILALAMVGVVGIAALGIDVFYIYWNKNRLQSGTDAAALAGATYLNGITFAGKNVSCVYSTDAQNAACSYALNDGVLLSELTSVVANTSNQSMTVSATRQVSALFARVVGIQNFTVSATSVAVLQGLLPPAMWLRSDSTAAPHTPMGNRSSCTTEVAVRVVGRDLP